MKTYFLIFTLILNVYAFSQQEEQPVHIFKGHDDAVKSVAFSPDGRLLLTGSTDKNAIICNLTDYKPLDKLDKHIADVKVITFSPDGKSIYTAADRFIRVWDLSGNLEYSMGSNATYLWSMSLNNDGTMIACGSYDPTVYVWKPSKDAKLVTKIKHHTKSVLVSSFSPNGKYLATGSLDLSICIWTTDSFKLLQTFKSHSGNIFDIAWFADSKRIISASADKSLRIWNIEKGTCDKIIEGHTLGVYTVALSPDGLFAYSGGADKTIIMWEVQTGKIIYTYYSHQQAINDIAFSSDGKYFATASDDKTAILWNYNPYLVVDAYYSNELQKEIEANPLFATKGKDENKVDYQARLLNANNERHSIYEKYYKKYLNK